MLVDAANRIIGPVIGTQRNLGFELEQATVLLRHAGVPHLLGVIDRIGGPAFFPTPGTPEWLQVNLFYESNDCTGTPFADVRNSLTPHVSVINGRRNTLYVGNPADATTINAHSRFYAIEQGGECGSPCIPPDPNCQAFGVPVTPVVDLDNLFTGPFRVP